MMMVNLLYAGIFIFILTSLWVLIASAKHKKFLFLYIPFAIALIGGSIFVYDGILGYPSRKALPEKFLVISYYVEKKDYIYLWVIPRKQNIPHYYRIVYSENTHKDLEKNKQSIESGTLIGENPNNNGVLVENSREQSLMFYDFRENIMRDKNAD